MALFLRSGSAAIKSAGRMFSSSASTQGFKRTPFVIASSMVVAGTTSYLAYNAMNAPISAASGAFPGDGNFFDLTLTDIKLISPNTGIFTFAFDDKNSTSGLITASAVLVKYVTAKGNNVIRPYTPISDVDQKGSLDLLVKEYPGGKASTHIHNLKPGDKLAFKGPIVKYAWTENKHDEIVLIGGGTGITPLYQLIHEINKNPADKTKVTLVYGNVTEDDILLKKELDSIASAKPDQFKIVYALDKPSESWKGITGYITKDVLSPLLPAPNAANIKIFICGPPPMYMSISGPKNSPQDQGELSGILKDLGYVKEQVLKF
ncbi:NADH-cytochrome b5 reductase [Lipomyces oligophaga]|uniref:NADH-cytochrome b5 reductase n=1 Tax=Lipomyces oligophaga TaxID=45792 RepID=UPI0034CDBB07